MAKHKQVPLNNGRVQPNGHLNGSVTTQSNGHLNGDAIGAKADIDEATYIDRWRLLDERGRQTWHYLSDEQLKTWSQSVADRYFLGLPTVGPSSKYLYCSLMIV